MKILRILMVLVLALASIQASARSAVPVINYKDVVITGSDGKPLTVEQIQKAIKNGAAERKWDVVDQGPGRMLATLHVRGKHTVMTEITYNTHALSFTYKDSVNMKYAPGPDGLGSIHPSYNTWVQNLKEAIRTSLARD